MALTVSTIYIYCIMITLVISDAFWDNLPMLITAIAAGCVSLFAAIRANQARNSSNDNKAAIEKVVTNVDGKMTQLLEAKDDVAKAKDDAHKIEDIKAAARNEGKLEAQREQELKNMPPK